MTKMRVLLSSGPGSPVLFKAPDLRYFGTLAAPVFLQSRAAKTLLGTENIKDSQWPGSQRLATFSETGSFNYVADCRHNYHFNAGNDFCIREDKDYPGLNE